MINPENTANPPSVHTTLVFKARGLLDIHELDEALQMLGIPETLLDTSPRSIVTGTEPGPWLACSLDSNGNARLWPAVHCS